MNLGCGCGGGGGGGGGGGEPRFGEIDVGVHALCLRSSV